MNYFKNLYQTFVNSFKIDKKTFIIFFYDILFYILIVIGILIIGGVFNFIAASKTEIISLLQQGAGGLSQDQLQNILINAKSLLFLIITSLLALIIYVIAILSVFKGLIWKKLLNKEFNKKFFIKFFITNLIWLIPVVLLLFASVLITASLLQDKLLLMQIVKWPVNIIIYLTLYFHIFFTYTLAKTNKVKESLVKMFYYGIIKFPVLIIPIIIILALIYLISRIYALLPIINPRLNLILYLIILIFYFALARIFLINSIKEFAEKQEATKI